jgi:hypothetical protein
MPPAQPPSWPQPAQPWPPQPAYPGQQQWGQPPYGYAPPRKTNGLAITSLVCGLAWIVVWPLALFTGIAAVVTGHIARGQIRRRDENGAGLALAGLILGYISIAISVLGAIALSVILFAVVPAAMQNEIRDDAQVFVDSMRESAAADSGQVRTIERLRDTFYRETRSTYTYGAGRDRYACCTEDDITLADGTPIAFATEADLERVDWRLQFRVDFITDKYACVRVPATVRIVEAATEGRCSS